MFLFPLAEVNKTKSKNSVILGTKRVYVRARAFKDPAEVGLIE